MASKGESDNPNCVKDIKDSNDWGTVSNWIVGNARQPAFQHGHHPYKRAVTDGSNGAEERDSGDGVQVRELREDDGGAGEDREPLDGGQRGAHARDVGPTHCLVENLGG